VDKADHFAGKLKELREAAGLSQQQLADKAGISLGAVRHFEQGLRGPAWKNVLALAAALGVSCEDFTALPAATDKAPRGRPKKDPAPAAKPKRPRGRPKKGGAS
jgi:transcriptional regulator with XRE-family HTH domain